ncbi:MAG: aldo/keto reductase, partial [Spirochaetia bacterium]|nr:aldo/keto reductase [Spirochaetia bacterium]
MNTTITLPGSNVQISRLLFGCWAMGGWYWGGADDAKSESAVRTALDLGITTFDTAPVYGFGRSEEVLGRALAGVPRESFQIATKCGLSWTDNAGTFFFETPDGPEGRPARVFRNLRCAAIRRECDLSLKRLGVDTIDLYQIHWTDPSIPFDEAARAFEELHAAGKI